MPSSLTSIIVVAADSGATLRECVARALASSAPVELMLVDNGSRDSVPQAIARACEHDDRVHVIYNHANLGFGPAVNVGARQAHGSTLLVLNPDCMLKPDTLARFLDVLHAHGAPDPASRRRDPLLLRSWNEMTGRAKRELENARFEGVDVPGVIPEAT